MIAHSRTNRGRLRTGLLLLALLGLSLSACQRRPQMPVAPPPPNYLEMGDHSFDAADYPAAIAAYSAYLRDHPESAAGDRVLFRLGMAFALPSNPSHDPAQAIGYMNQLSRQFPDSPWRPQAELLASLQQQIQQLQLDVAQRESQLSGLSREMEQLNQQQASEVERLQGDVENREARIRQLSQELESLKAIDMQRRPATPPR